MITGVGALSSGFNVSVTSVLHSSGILEGKDRDDPKTVPLKIFAKDIGNCAYVSSSSLSLSAQREHHRLFLSVWGPIYDISRNKLKQPTERFQNFSPQAKTLAVSNADSTDDVIRMALLQFGISVSNQRPLLIFTPVHTHFCPFDVVSKVIQADPCSHGQALL